MSKTRKKAVAQHGMLPTDLRVQSRNRSAVHWIDARGEAACGRPLDADQIATKLTKDITLASCAVCCKAIELERKKDFFGRVKVADPTPIDFGPLSEPRVPR